MTGIHRLSTAALELGYEAHGPEDGEVAILLHGFPYSPRAYDEVAPELAALGYRVLVPFLRGFGATRLRPGAARTGQQAALAQDLRDLMDGLGIARAALAGYDWGGRAACIAAALWPQRVRCLVTANGYNIQNIAAAAEPAAPEHEHRLWYQYYFHTARGQAGLAANRHALCRLLWQLWSPEWRFDAATYDASARHFDHPDFVDLVIHSYRHRYGVVPGDPALDPIEQALSLQPAIAVPSVALWGGADGVAPAPAEDPHRAKFTGPYARHILPGIGHNIPQEAPAEVLAALTRLLRSSPP